jgi:hypothetical protein
MLKYIDNLPHITCCINWHLNESIFFQRLLCIFAKSVKIRKNTLIVSTYRSNQNPISRLRNPHQRIWKWPKMPSQIRSKSPIKMQILPIAFQYFERPFKRKTY